MDKLVLLDSNSLLNRAFYALPPMSAVDGRPTNAVYGYVNMLLKIITEAKPTHIIATFDLKAPTFRKKMYSEYKAQRKPMPEELAAQLPIIKGVLASMNINIITLEGYEADDLIGTIAKKCPFETIIVTGDRDSLQLVSDTTKVWLTKKGITEIVEYDIARLAEDGLTPAGVIDLKSLMGDTADNIPGVAGVGEKTAKTLLQTYGDLDGVYAHIDEIKGKLQEKLITNKDMAYLSYQLATINVDSPVEINFDDCVVKDYMNKDSIACFKSLNFKTIVSRFGDSINDSTENNEKEENKQLANVETIQIEDFAQFNKLMQDLQKKSVITIYVDNDVEIFADNICYKIVSSQDLLGSGIDFYEIADEINKLLQNDNIKIILFDAKTNFYQLRTEKASCYEDVALKVYLLDANRNYKKIEEVIQDYSVESGSISYSLYMLNEICDKKMQELGLVDLYKNIELPLINVLYDMERVGVKVDLNLLEELRESFFNIITDLTNKIISYNNNEPFNINSPKQLGEFLFVKLGLKHGKKTKTGFSTNVEVLQSLVGSHPVIEDILKYREINKLLSTYIDGLKPLIVGGRVHTVFKQMVAATGRLSSTEPNLQNIPVRKAVGRELRKMFIASDGCKIVCADYSQIELRLMAHFSEDENLIKAFNDGLDVHKFTASRAFGVPFEMVSSDMRRRAKAINFGIIYGISSFGLSNDIGISPYEAKRFIDKYFEMYPKVKEYMDNNVIFAKENGYISTLSGRIRYIPEINVSNFQTRSFGERIAMNMPLQGSASDIIKMAMIDVAKKLEDGGFKAKLVLQVHDELLIDCPDDEVIKVERLLKESMENIVKLRVKLEVDVSVGNNWLEAK